MSLTSPAFSERQTIPKKHTADGEDVSPELAWDEPPAGTQSFAVVCQDPDAPAGTFVHWLVWNLPANARKLAEALSPTSEADGMRQGKNGFGKIGWRGPSPPRGTPHRYVFEVYALDAHPNVRSGGTRADLDRAMAGHVLGVGTLIGLYGR